MVGQVPVELRAINEPHIETARQMPPHLQQYARITPFAHGYGQPFAIQRQHHHTVLASKDIGDIDGAGGTVQKA